MINSVKQSARDLKNVPKDFDHILDCIADAKVVMNGEASHGTHEFYKESP